MHQKVVISGGPGTGKSTVISTLQELEYVCMPELSRIVTLQAQKRGIDQLFLEDPLVFSELLLNGRINQYKMAEEMSDELIFFDRGIPDVMGYLDYLGVSYPELYQVKSKELRYTRVFMMPPWKKIYRKDNERYENFEQSMRIFSELKKTYARLGYQFEIVPEASVENRVEFILRSLGV
jgi:predicted ATPase